MSRTRIVYKDIAVGADSDAEVTASGETSFSEPGQIPFGLGTGPVATFELGGWILDGRHTFIETQRAAFWSDELSGADCIFANPPTIEINFDEQYTLLGINLVFDPENGDYCSDINIKYYQGSTLKADYDFAPTGTSYFCAGEAQSFNRILITLRATSLPYRRAKVNHVQFGIVREFGMTELRSAKITSQTNLISSQLPISKLTWTLNSRDDVDYIFQAKQPVEAYAGDSLLGVFYISNSRRTSRSVHNIETEDAVGVLADAPFAGGSYLSGISAATLLRQIVGTAFDVIIEADDTTVYGVIKAGTKRDAMQQVLFAWGAILTTDGTNALRVTSLGDTLREVSKNRAYVSASVQTRALVTQVKVTAHTYTASSSGDVEVGGSKYSDTKTVYTVTNPNVTDADKENVITVDNATLVSTRNGQAVAQRVYDYYMLRQTASGKIVLDGERLGDYIGLPNDWGVQKGHISKLDITLSNTVAASVTAVG